MPATKKTKSSAGKTDNSKLRVRVQAYEPNILDLSVKQIVETGTRLNVEIVGPVNLPTKIKKYTVNRAPFVFKTAREQFEMRIHTRFVDIINPSQQVVEALSNLDLPAGVSVEAQIRS